MTEGRAVSVRRLPDCDSAVALPPVEAVDQLDCDGLVDLLTALGALAERARARLALVGTAPAPAPPAEEHLTAEQVAQLLNAEPSWVYRHARQLGGAKLDGILRFPRRRLDQSLARQARLGS